MGMPSTWQQGLSWLRAPANELAFALRNALRWSRGAPILPDEGKQDLFAALSPKARAQAERVANELTQRYDLHRLLARSTRASWAGSLQHLLGLERLVGTLPLPMGADGVVRALDVGCGDFHYATALQRWLARQASTSTTAANSNSPATASSVVLRGIELDGHGLYADWRSRADHARAHADLAAVAGSTVLFQVGDFTRLALPTQDVVTAFFPFLTSYACLRWGAPVSRCSPRRLLARAVATVRPGGWLLVVNQTNDECGRLRRLLAQHPVELVASCEWQCDLVPWRESTCGQIGSLWRRSLG